MLCQLAVVIVSVLASMWTLMWEICPDLVLPIHRYTDNLSYGSVQSMPWPQQTSMFRILQISDPQVENVWDSCKDVSKKPCSVRNTTGFIASLVRVYSPDFVVVTGDVVFGPRAPHQTVHAALDPISHIPHAVILGNHDVQRCAAWNQKQLTDFIYSRATLGGTSLLRVGNGLLCVWMIDYSYLHREWVNPNHLKWIRENLDLCPNPQSALAFIHFPVSNFSVRTGSMNEPISHPKVSTELRTTLRMIPGLRAVGFGHDHTNDFCGSLDKNVSGCYAGSVGYTTYGKRGFDRRARIFDVTSYGQITTFKVSDGTPMRAFDMETFI